MSINDLRSGDPAGSGSRSCPLCMQEETDPEQFQCRWCSTDLPTAWPPARPDDSGSPEVTAELPGRAQGPGGDEEIRFIGGVWSDVTSVSAPVPQTEAAAPASVEDDWGFRPVETLSPQAKKARGARPPEEASDSASAPVPRRLRLSNPDMDIPITAGAGVLLGREQPSPLAAHPSVNPYVSSTHARVLVDLLDPTTVHLVDEGSTNGTLLNDVPLVPHVRMQIVVGDRIQLTRMNPVILEVLE